MAEKFSIIAKAQKRYSQKMKVDKKKTKMGIKDSLWMYKQFRNNNLESRDKLTKISLKNKNAKPSKIKDRLFMLSLYRKINKILYQKTQK